MFDFFEYYIDILINISMLLSIGSLFILLPFKLKNTSLQTQIISGVFLSLMGLLIMNAQFNITTGFLLDTRSVLLSLSAAFLGLIPGLITAISLSLFRMHQGGAGALTGVIVIFATMGTGLLFRKFRLEKLKIKSISVYIELYVFGIVVHLIMLLCFFTLPFDVAIKVLGLIFWPVMILYPIATIPLGLILVKQRENMENSEKVSFISKHDYLTGLFNRHYLEEAFEKYDKEAYYPLTLILGDVNGLKLINDSYGHLVGDKLLILISNILKETSREKDVLARWGGDEFMFILPNTTLEEGRKIIREIKEKCNTRKFKEISPSISLGTATKSDVTESLDDVISKTEKFMYRNKLSESKSVRSSFISILETTLLERKYESENHSKNLIDYGVLIGKKLKLSEPDIDKLKLIARLHDIGKIGISEDILLKNGKLTTLEFEEIKKHPVIGFRILNSIEELKHVARPILHHHERFDGTGYPSGLAGEDIPLLSRITSISDAFEVMICGRVYQEAKSKEAAIKELKDNAGTQFDPNLVEIFIESLNN